MKAGHSDDLTVNAEPADFKNMLGSAFALFVAVFVCTFPVFLLGYSIANSSVSDTAIHAAVAAITGIFTFAVSNIAYNSGHTSIFTIIAMTVSLIAMFAGGIVFLAIAIFYAVYIPVSDVYYCVRAHKERNADLEESSGRTRAKHINRIIKRYAIRLAGT